MRMPLLLPSALDTSGENRAQCLVVVGWRYWSRGARSSLPGRSICHSAT
jgi:hypothetical protein